MQLFELIRRLIDIESISGNEAKVGEFLFDHLSKLAVCYGGRAERMDVEPGRFNVFAQWGEPTVTLSTHMDTVPPFLASREDEEHIWGRGSCDAKGIIGAMIAAAERLLEEGVRNFALLFVVGEERNSAGALAAAKQPRGSRYLINGEPTENKVAVGAKGALRYEITAHGRMAHSAHPELGESAIEKLLDALDAIRQIPLPEDTVLGRSTLNIGTISGGHAPNVIPNLAGAEIMFRLVGDAAPIRAAVSRAVAGRAELREVLHTPAARLGTFDGLSTTVVAYTTDIPILGAAWGRPFLVGPGSIDLAHTVEERVPKRQLLDAAELYRKMVTRLAASA
jgi:acetylornithine deacetylase